MNRGNGRRRIFHKPQDYSAFIKILDEALGRFDVQLLCWCLMPNHWHLVLLPASSKAMTRFMQFLTVTHVRRHHAHHDSPAGHLYQGRYKSFAVQDTHHFLVLCRYVENNARRARLVKTAEQWRWCSLHQWLNGSREPRLSEWPIARPRGWARLVNRPMDENDEVRVRASMTRDRPLGDDEWMKRIAARLGVEQALRPLGRPRKTVEQLSPRQRRRRKQRADGHFGK